jgi:hypothetical protein
MTAHANATTKKAKPSSAGHAGAPDNGSNGRSRDEMDRRALTVEERIGRLDRLARHNAGLPALADEAFDREMLATV